MIVTEEFEGNLSSSLAWLHAMLFAIAAHLSTMATKSVVDELSLVTWNAGMGYNLLMANVNPEGNFIHSGVDSRK